MFFVERYNTMIKNRQQTTAETKERRHSRARFYWINLQSVLNVRRRQGISRDVLEIADCMIEDYHTDLEYLKDK